MPPFDIKNLYYITHASNIPSILKNGILSHDKVERQQVDFTPIYDTQIVSKRKEKTIPDKESLWNYANLYFQPRNPMMYRVVHEKDKRDIALIAIKPILLSESEIIITDGNAANNATKFYSFSQGKGILQQNWKIIQNEWWNELDGSKRKIMSECLIPHKVNPELIDSIFVTDIEAQKKVKNLMGSSTIPIIPEPYLFFQPRSAIRINNICGPITVVCSAS